MAVKYDKNTDYMALINEANKAGNTKAAAAYEAARNAKIADMNKAGTNTSNYQTTNNYSKYSNNPTIADHQAYINQTHPGGLDAYTKLQNDRYNTALANNDLDLLNRLQADANRVGYKLTSNVAPVNPMMDMVNPYTALLEKNQAQYDNLLKDYRSVIDASVNRGMGNLEAQKGAINQGSDEMARQAYILSRQNARSLPQQLASRGLTGGATETAQLGLMSNYENNLNNINTNRFNALNQVDTAKTDLANQGELSFAEQTLANNQAAINAYRSMLGQSVNFDQWQADRNLGQNNYMNETATANKQQEFNNILKRLAMGLISPQDAVTLGVPAQDVQALVNQINQPAVKASGGSGGSTGGGGLADGVMETAIKHLQKGDREKAIAALASIMSFEEIKSFMEQNGVRTDDIDWGIEQAPAQSSSILDVNSPYQKFVGTPKALETLVSYYKGKGYTDSQIASILNK